MNNLFIFILAVTQHIALVTRKRVTSSAYKISPLRIRLFTGSMLATLSIKLFRFVDAEIKFIELPIDILIKKNYTSIQQRYNRGVENSN